ncbi:hypothetical protein B0H21DRAFT_190877 [Amylocystis lapponica]|nr:hypothetical protein B0H21DRAFT_190877 [Amylocystis lapponica]
MALKAPSRRPEKLMLSDTNLTANTPISTFVRRKTPQSSPASPTFPHRMKNRSISPSAPVSIPTVPLVFPPQSRYPSSDSDDDDTPLASAPLSRFHTFPRHTIKVSPPLPQYDSSGVRISAFARPRDMESQHQLHITPVA